MVNLGVYPSSRRLNMALTARFAAVTRPLADPRKGLHKKLANHIYDWHPNHRYL